MVATKDYVFSLLSDFIGESANKILVPSSEYEYGTSPDPTIAMDEDGDIWNIEDMIGYSVMRGATKVVIIPTQEDFVIKLNITGTYLSEKECETFGYEFPHIDRVSIQNILDEEIAMYDNMPTELKEFIKPNIFIGYFNNIPVYIQEKIKASYEYSEEASWERFIKRGDSLKVTEVQTVNKHLIPSFPAPFISDMFEIFGEENTKTILCQLRESAVYDLNYGNFGYDMENKPCLFDIGGFDEAEFFHKDE